MVEVIEDKFDFAVYPVVDRFRRYDPKHPHGDLYNDFINRLLRCHVGYKGHIVMFPGVENLPEGSSYHIEANRFGDSVNTNHFPYPPLVDAYDTEDFAKFEADFKGNNYDPVWDLSNEPPLAQKLIRILELDMDESDYWDERLLFRFYALNSFLGQDTFTTFGEFFENCADEVYADFRIFKENENEHTEKLFEAYKHKGCLLRFVELKGKTAKTHIQMFYSMTKEDVLGLTREEQISPNFMKSKLNKNLLESLEVIRLGKEVFDHKKYVEEVSETVSNVLEKDGFNVQGGILKRRKTAIIKAAMRTISATADFVNGYKNEETSLLEIKEIIDRDADKLVAADFIAFLTVLRYPKFFMNRAGRLAVEIHIEGLKRFGTVEYMRFVKEVLMDHNGDLPTYSDWKLFMEQDGDLDEDLNPSIMIYTILNSDKEQFRDLDKIVQARRVVKEIENACNR